VTLEEAKQLAAEETLEEKVRPVESLFLSRPVLKVSPAQAQRFRNGGALSLERVSYRFPVGKTARYTAFVRRRRNSLGWAG
jgi:tRNA pseudouridine55 synthase